MAFSAHKNDAEMIEHYDSAEELERKVLLVADKIRKSRHTVFFTGAGISTDAGIPDFRGPKGVWTCKANGTKVQRGTDTLSAIPTKTHMSIVELFRNGYLHYLISQNCDGLHRRSGVQSEMISELHGNGNIEYCEDCGFEYLRDYHCYRITRGRDHYTGRHCVNTRNGKKCKGRLLESTIDFGQNLPQLPLEKAQHHSEKATLHVALGSSLTVRPACNMPKLTAKTNGELVICNLQITPLDDLSTIRIHHRCDVFMEALMKALNLQIPEFTLHRKFQVIASLSIDKIPRNIKIRGVEKGTSGQMIPATIFRSVELHQSNNKKETCTIQNLDQIPIFKQGIAPLRFTIHTMQHYAEPPLELTVKANYESDIDEIMHVSYSPSTGIWRAMSDNVSINNDDTQQWIVKACEFKMGPSSHDDGPKARMWATLDCITRQNGESLVLAGGAPRENDLPGLWALHNNKWIRVTPTTRPNDTTPYLDQHRWGHASCVLDNRYVMLFGGWDSRSQYSDCFAYDCVASIFEKVSYKDGTPPSPRAGSSLTVMPDSTIYVFGGSCCEGGAYVFFNELYQFSPKNCSWTSLSTVGDIPSPRSQHSTILLSPSTMLLIGGYCGDRVLTDVYTLDLTARPHCWKRIHPDGEGPESYKVDQKAFRVYPAGHHGVLIKNDDLNTKIVFYYGATGVHVLDVTRWHWSIAQSSEMMRLRKGSCKTALANSTVACFGGESTSDTACFFTVA